MQREGAPERRQKLPHEGQSAPDGPLSCPTSVRQKDAFIQQTFSQDPPYMPGTLLSISTTKINKIRSLSSEVQDRKDRMRKMVHRKKRRLSAWKFLERERVNENKEQGGGGREGGRREGGCLSCDTTAPKHADKPATLV